MRSMNEGAERYSAGKTRSATSTTHTRNTGCANNKTVTNTSGNMQTVAVINAKGGSGKTTISTNLASYYAHNGHNTVIIDYDSQGSSTHWTSNRCEMQPHIHNIPAYKMPAGATQTFQMKLPAGTERIVIDTPGAISLSQLEKIVKRADFIIIPVQPSSIDIHAVTGFIHQLLRLRQVQWGKVKIAVMANRVKENTDIFSTLTDFLKNLNIPFLSQIKDSQNYVHAANEAKGVFEMEHEHSIAKDKTDWHAVINWLEQKDVFTELTVVPNMPLTMNNSEDKTPLEEAI